MRPWRRNAAGPSPEPAASSRLARGQGGRRALALFLGSLCMASLGLMTSGCGFHARRSLGPEYGTVGIEIFANDTLEPDLERRLHAELSRAVARMIDCTLTDPDRAAVRIEGRLLEYRTRGGVRDPENRLQERGVIITVRASMRTHGGERIAGPVRLTTGSGFRAGEPMGQGLAEERVLGNLAEGLMMELLVALEAQQEIP